MKKKKVMILVNSMTHNGAERIAFNQYLLLEKKTDITLVSCYSDDFYIGDKNINIIYLTKIFSNSSLLKKLICLPKLLLKIITIKKDIKPDVVISHLNLSNYLNILTKNYYQSAKKIVYIHSAILPNKQIKPITTFFNICLIRLLLKSADKIICVSNSTKSELAKVLCLNEVSVEVIYNPIAISKIQKNAIKLGTPFQISQTNIVAIGLRKNKNIPHLLNAFKQVLNNQQNLVLTIIGDDKLKETYEKMSIELEIEKSIRFTGAIDNPFVYLKNADMMILNSICEGLPTVLIEALACGCPIIATDCFSGPREILAPHTNQAKQLTDSFEICDYGILIPVNNSKSLTESICYLMNNKELKEKFKIAGPKRAIEFDQKKSIMKFERVLGNI